VALSKSDGVNQKFALLQIERDGQKLKLIVGPSFGIMLVALVGAIAGKGSLGSLCLFLSGGGLALVGQLLWRWLQVLKN